MRWIVLGGVWLAALGGVLLSVAWIEAPRWLVAASYLLVGAPERNMLVNLLRGNIIRNISSILPEEIHLLVYA